MLYDRNELRFKEISKVKAYLTIARGCYYVPKIVKKPRNDKTIKIRVEIFLNLQDLSVFYPENYDHILNEFNNYLNRMGLKNSDKKFTNIIN